MKTDVKTGFAGAFRSLKARVFIAIFLTGLICCLIMRFGIIQSYENRAIKVRTSDVQNQVVIMADHLLRYDFLNDQSSEVIKAEIQQLSNLYDGRVLVVNENFAIIYDSYNTSTGKIFISEEVIRSFNKETLTNYDDKNQYIEMTVPIVVAGDDEKGRVAGVIVASVSADSVIKNGEILSRQAMIISVFLLIVVLAAAVSTAHFMLKPFNRVTDAINEVKAGFSDEKIEVNNYVETKEIIDAFNQLLARMKALDDSRNEFVSNVSHELKTPLASMKVLADSLNTGEEVPVEMYKEFMSDIVDEIDRENDIINDLLSLVKMDKTSTSLNIEQVNINELIESIFKRLGPIAKKAQIDLIFESTREVLADIDNVKMTLALTNLIENGIKYNVEGGYVKVILDADYQTCMIVVEDSGIGIGEEEQIHVFERFYRVDKSHSKEIGGTGLGLAIVKSSILRHRGSITLSSTPGEGSVFTVKFPLTNNANAK